MIFIGLIKSVQILIELVSDVLSFIVHTDEDIDLFFFFQPERRGHGKKGRRTSCGDVVEMICGLRMIQSAGADEVGKGCAVSFHAFSFVQQHRKAFFAVTFFRLMMGGQSDRSAVFVIQLALHDHIGIDDVARQRSRIGDPEHSGRHDLQIPGFFFKIFDTDALHLDGGRHIFLLRQKEDRPRDLQTAVRLIDDPAVILRVDAVCALNVFFDIERIKDLPAVLKQIKLPVRRFAVLFRREDITGRQDLFLLFPAERSASELVERRFRRRLQTVGVFAAVAQKKVDAVMGTDRIGFQIDLELTVIIELAGGRQEGIVNIADRFVESVIRFISLTVGIDADLFFFFDQDMIVERYHLLIDIRIRDQMHADRCIVGKAAEGKDLVPPDIKKQGIKMSVQSIFEDRFRRLYRRDRLISARFDLKVHDSSFFEKRRKRSAFASFTYRL